VIDDVITSGGAKIEAVVPLKEAGLVVEDVLVVVDREDRGAATLAEAGLRLHSVLKVRDLLAHLKSSGVVAEADVQRALDFLTEAKVHV
jgi:uridine monophosphate synthetase